MKYNEFFKHRLDNIVNNQQDHNPIKEGMILNVNKLISDTIRVPEGNYIVAVVTSDSCVLVPTNEAGQQKFEVFKPTLAGFFNPEVHRKEVSKANDNTILDSN